MDSLLDTVEEQLTPFLTDRRWLVAYSGGVDSHVLLHLAQKILQKKNLNSPTIVAVHINHQLQVEADQWQQHCQQQAEQLGVSFYTKAVSITCSSRESLEDKARHARYEVFETLIEPGDVLLMGHHLDDQIETLMMRMLRGSGSKGASGMPKQRVIAAGKLLRPLLDVSRSDIEAYAKQEKLSWVEDPSNQSDNYDRNFLRLKLLPLMSERWPEYRKTLSRVAVLNEESASLNEELAAIDCQGLQLNSNSIPLESLQTLNHARQKNLLRYWIKQKAMVMPSAQQLDQVLGSVVNAKQDAEPLVEWQGVQARRFKNQLYIMSAQSIAEAELAVSYSWQIDRTLEINSVGKLSTHTVKGQGISQERLKHYNNTVEIKFRCGGERCQPAGRSGSQTLKKLFQEYQVEPWLRDSVPLIYLADELIAVADLWVCEGWQASGKEAGLAISWNKVN